MGKYVYKKRNFLLIKQGKKRPPKNVRRKQKRGNLLLMGLN